MAESRIIKRNVLFWGKSGLQLTWHDVDLHGCIWIPV